MRVAAALRPWVLAAAVTATASCGDGPGQRRADGVPDGSQRATVVRVVDGDTVILRGTGDGVLPREDTRVRLLEIDSPESVAPDRPVECFGEEAARGLAEMVPAGSTVSVVPDRQLEDPYGRLLLYVWDDDGALVNLEMVRSGLAEAVLFQPNDRYIDEMRQAEQEARSEARGMWGAC